MTDVSQSWNTTRCLSLLCTSARQVWLCPSCTGTSISASSACGSAAIVLSVLHHSAGLANTDLDVALVSSWGSEIPPGHRLAQRPGVKLPACVLCHLPFLKCHDAARDCLVTFQVLQNGKIQKFSACFVKKSRTEELFNPQIIVINRSRVWESQEI